MVSLATVDAYVDFMLWYLLALVIMHYARALKSKYEAARELKKHEAARDVDGSH